MKLIQLMLIFLGCLFPAQILPAIDLQTPSANLTIISKKISFPNFPRAFNPSICKVDEGILMTFRYFPDHTRQWISEAYIVLLDESFNPISQPQLLSFRDTNTFPPFYSDCRLFSYQEKLYIVYSDFTDFDYPGDINYNPYVSCNEFMQLVGLDFDLRFNTTPSIKLFHQEKQYRYRREKNWSPFEWNGKLFLSYYPFPHEILEPDLATGECKRVYLTHAEHPWKWGELRLSTPALLVDGEYLAFFHSSMKLVSPESRERDVLHYFFGAYTFSSEPPFEITKASPEPIIAKGMYTYSDDWLHCVFPLSYVVSGDDIYLSYGKDDREIWIVKLSKKELLDSLVPVNLKLENND